MLGYADDIDALAHTLEEAEEIVGILETAAADVGLKINADKTKTLHMGRSSLQQRLTAPRYEEVKEFRYLGSIVTADNNTSADVASRIKAANVAYFQTRPLFNSRILSWTTKIRLYKTLVRPVLMYGAETWPLTRRDENRLRVFENRMLRRIFGGTVSNGVWRIRHNAEIHRLYKSADILAELRARRLQWAGHVARMDDARTAKRVMDAPPLNQPRPRGRPRRRWREALHEDLRAVGIDPAGWRAVAADRVTWRTAAVCAAKSPPGLNSPP